MKTYWNVCINGQAVRTFSTREEARVYARAERSNLPVIAVEQVVVPNFTPDPIPLADSEVEALEDARVQAALDRVI
jgi:hypothetical protein